MYFFINNKFVSKNLYNGDGQNEMRCQSLWMIYLVTITDCMHGVWDEFASGTLACSECRERCE